MAKLVISAKMAQEMADTGWGSRAETVSDISRLQLLRAMETPRGDGSLLVDDVFPSLLARLYFEAEKLIDSYRYGDRDAYGLGMYNAGRTMQKRIAEALGRSLSYPEARELMYACRHGLTACYDCGVGDLDSSG